MRQGSVRGNVERQAEEDVTGALIKLAREFAVCHIELQDLSVLADDSGLFHSPLCIYDRDLSITAERVKVSSVRLHYIALAHALHRDVLRVGYVAHIIVRIKFVLAAVELYPVGEPFQF